MPSGAFGLAESSSEHVLDIPGAGSGMRGTCGGGRGRKLTSKRNICSMWFVESRTLNI